MVQICVMSLHSLPFASIRRDFRVIRHNVDVSALLFSQKMVQYATEDGLEASGDDVERYVIVDAKFVEGLKVRVDIECILHDREAIFKRDSERGIQFVRDFAEGALAGLHLLGKDSATVRSASEVVEQGYVRHLV